ncbi:DUF4340 domain-containing protein [Methylophaga sp. OBS1]|uniref:DUF4340 domain-containing protein n=1 Tax=Methylophaga sp. OBS1 TaxID=2991933 RepID=UPI0022591CB0|nr:DUF4340 domain-containing protein [Methylophaga sp. OBS1]MCX4192874.1 DUF4340 domain-containing protein [Methylophaga sp. OBS1]
MKSSYLTNLILLAIVIALLWLSQREQAPEEEAATLSTLETEDIELIQIAREGKVNLRLERQQSQWILTAPFNARANPTRVNLLLSLLKAPVHGEFQPMDEAALQQFGLSDPEVILSMNNEQFAFGGVESISENRYVLHQGMIFLVQDDVTPLLTASAGSFVDNRLIAETNRLNRLSLPSTLDSDDRINLSLQDGQWQSDNVELSADAMKMLADSWQHAYAMQVRYLNDMALSRLQEPQVKLWLADHSEPVQLLMRQNGDTLQLINPALRLQYDFPLAMLSQLLPSPPTP